jgi:hypothetical protein
MTPTSLPRLDFGEIPLVTSASWQVHNSKSHKSAINSLLLVLQIEI